MDARKGNSSEYSNCNFANPVIVIIPVSTNGVHGVDWVQAERAVLILAGSFSEHKLKRCTT